MRKAAGASLIVDGAVTADKIAANTITAGQIAVGAIGADEIAANVIAVKHLVVADFSNIAANGDFESGSDHWTLSGGASVISYSSAPPKGHCLDLDGINATAYQDATFPVATGESYFFSAYGSKYTVNGPLYLGLRVVDKDGGVSWETINLPTSAGSGWQRFSGTVTIQAANARTGKVYVFNDATSTTRWLAAQIVCRRAANAELIVDGAITAAKVSTNEIIASSANLGSAVVSTIKIQDNAVTVPVSASASNTTGIGEGDANATEIISATITTHGQPVHIFFLVEHTTFNAGYDLHHHIFRDSTELRYYVDYLNLNYACGQYSIMDQPAAGTYTYKIKTNTHAGGGTTSSVYWRNLILLEVQK
jgi:hypothetical protein